MNSPVQRQGRLVLLIDADPATRATVRAQAEFAVSGDLLEAARELARGMPDEPASAW